MHLARQHAQHGQKRGKPGRKECTKCRTFQCAWNTGNSNTRDAKCHTKVYNSTPGTQSAREVQDSTPLTAGTNWDDRHDEAMDYSLELTWEDEDEESAPDAKGVKLFKVSEKTEKFLQNTFSITSSDSVRRQ